MGYVLKRLALGIALIGFAAAVLLLSDWQHRQRRRPSGSAPVAMGKLPRVAIFQFSSRQILDESVRGCLDTFAKHNLIPNKTVFIQRFNAESDLPTANTIAKAIVGGGFDLAITISTPALQTVAGANHEGKVVHVFGTVTDPYLSGVGLDRKRPDVRPRNLAGIGTFQPVKEVFRLAKQCYPGLTRVGVVWCTSETCSEACLVLAREVCKELGITLLEAPVQSTTEVFEAAQSLVARDAQALWIGGDNIVEIAAGSVIKPALEARIPVFANAPDHAQTGALLGLGADYYEVGQATGNLAVEILNGRDPRSTPIENVVPQKMAVNLVTLAQLRDPWKITPEIMRSAAIIIDDHGLHATNPSPTTTATIPRPEAGRIYRIGIGYFAPEQGYETVARGLLEGLREFGYTEGSNLVVRRVSAQADMAAIPAVIQALDSSDADVIVTFTTPVLIAAASLAKHKPVVFTYVTDPIAAGIGKSWTDHLPNVTGVGSFPPLEETLDLIKRLIPNLSGLGVIYNSGEANSAKVVAVLRNLCRQRNIHLEEVTLNTTADMAQSAQALLERPIQAVYVPGDNTVYQGFDALAMACHKARMPLFPDDPLKVNQALACIGPGYYHGGRGAAPLLARVLGGESPAGIPMTNVSVKTIVINRDEASRLGIKVPADLLLDQLSTAGIPISVIAPTPAVVTASAAVAVSAAIAASAIAVPRVLSAPPERKWKIHLLHYAESTVVEDFERGLWDELPKAGLKRGRDYEIKVSNAQGNMANLVAMVDEANSGRTDLILLTSTPTLQAAAQRVKNTPMIFSVVANPMLAGIGPSFNEHAPNITGICTMSDYETMGRVIRECLPRARRLGTLFASGEDSCIYNKDAMAAVLRKANIELVAMPVTASSDISEAALALAGKDIDGFCQVIGNIIDASFAGITRTVQKTKLPLFGFATSQARNGGAVVVVARDYEQSGRDTARLAARILRGESPAHIPIQLVSKTRLVINLANAAACGLTIPPSLLDRADEVIGRPPVQAVPSACAGPSVFAKAPPDASAGRPERKWRLVFLNYVQSQFVEETYRGFFERLEHHGLRRNHDYDIKILNAHSDMATLMAIATAAADNRPDLILLTSTPTLQAVLQKVHDIPIVFGAVGNPVLAGAGQSVTQHLPNITGISTLSDFAGMVAVVKECLPDARRIGTLFVPSEINSVLYRDSLAEAARRGGLDLESVAVSTSTEVPDAAMALASKPVDAICQITDNLNDASFPGIVQAARRYRKPLMAFVSGQVINGGAALAVARDYEQVGRDMADLALRILHGESPATIPFRPVSRTRLVVNPENAARCGLKLPSALLKRADQVVGQP